MLLFILSTKTVFMSYDASSNSRICILLLIWDFDSSSFNIFTSFCIYGQIYFKFLATHHLNLHHLQLFLLFVFNLGFHLCSPVFCHVEWFWTPEMVNKTKTRLQILYSSWECLQFSSRLTEWWEIMSINSGMWWDQDSSQYCEHQFTTDLCLVI